MWVYVWRTLKDLRIANPGHSNANGLCKAYMVLRRNKPLPIIGEIHLAAKYLTMRIVVHEVTHAAIEWAARSRHIPRFSHPRSEYRMARGKGNGLVLTPRSSEERFCHALADMSADLVHKFYKHRLLKETETT